MKLFCGLIWYDFFFFYFFGDGVSDNLFVLIFLYDEGDSNLFYSCNLCYFDDLSDLDDSGDSGDDNDLDDFDDFDEIVVFWW